MHIKFPVLALLDLPLAVSRQRGLRFLVAGISATLLNRVRVQQLGVRDAGGGELLAGLGAGGDGGGVPGLLRGGGGVFGVVAMQVVGAERGLGGGVGEALSAFGEALVAFGEVLRAAVGAEEAIERGLGAATGIQQGTAGLREIR